MTHWPPTFEAEPCGAGAWHAARTTSKTMASLDSERFTVPLPRDEARPGDYPAAASVGLSGSPVRHLDDLQRRVSCDRLKVSIVVKERGVSSDHRDGDQAIAEATERLARVAARPVDQSGLLEIAQPL